jgi:hypothetical protein
LGPPGLALEGQIKNLLAKIDVGDTRWQDITIGLEWFGREFDEEIDRSKDDK